MLLLVWNVIALEDGHDLEAIKNAIEEDKKKVIDKPTVIVCKTIKGKRRNRIMENQAGWHGTAPNKEQCDLALKEIGEGKHND